jgi:5,10-methylenetetrahydromethanopterin reductase
VGAVQLWVPGISLARYAAAQAERAEARGFDGILFVDSQNLAEDVYVTMALAAGATSRIAIGTGVTNPYTRHPAVTAASIATVQELSDGRAVLGIGRGDSALAYLGLAPAPVPVFERYVQRVQAYLAGEEPAAGDDETLPSIDAGSLPLAQQPRRRIEWLARSSLPKVPVEVVGTGPRVLEVGGRLAERVTVSVGADPARVEWALDVARRAHADAGLDPGSLSLGAYVNVVAHPDAGVAAHLARPSVLSFARFSAMHGPAVGPAADTDRATLETIAPAYNMNRHFRHRDDEGPALPPGFVERFGVVGAPATCAERLAELAALGLDRLVVVGPAAPADPAAADAEACWVEEVAPTLRAG